MAVAGRVLIKFRGNYDSTVSYSPLDAVFYPEENSTYVCTQLSLGNLPTNTTYWQIMAKGLSSVDPEDIGFGYGTCTTASDTDAKIATLADYVLTVNGFVAISFTNAVNANATLNINNQGARPIYNKGVAIEDEVIEAGDTAAFVYDGTHYNLITSSGSSGHIIQGPAGTDIAKEKRMQFIDAGVTDDSTNGKTKVEVIQRVTSAQYVNAPDGIYDVYDDPGTSIDLNQLGDVNINTPLDGQGLVYDYDTDKWKNKTIAPDLTSETVTGIPLTFTTDSECVANNTVITFEPKQKGSGDASPSNPRDIVGYKTISNRVTKKNLFDKNNIKTTSTKEETINPIPVVVGATYIFSGIASGKAFRVYEYGEDRSDAIKNYLLNNSTGAITFDTCTQFIDLSGDIGWLTDSVQLELGSTATTYEAYNPITDISESLPETLYGFTWHVEDGEIVVTHLKYDMGSFSWGRTSDNVFYANTNNMAHKKKDGLTNILCEIYKTVEAIKDKSITGSVDNNYRIFVKDTTYSEATDFKTAVTGKYVVYELDEPIRIQLLAHSVKLLSCANVVTTNGTTISLTYRNGEIAKLSDLGALADGINGLGDFANESQKDIDYLLNKDHKIETMSSEETKSIILDENSVYLFSFYRVNAGGYRALYVVFCFPNALVVPIIAPTSGNTPIASGTNKSEVIITAPSNSYVVMYHKIGDASYAH